jgi:urease accessory protein
VIVAEEFARQTWEAELALRYENVDGRSVLTQRQHRGPLLVQKAFYPEGDAVCHSIIVHPPGGIVAGDRLSINAAIEANAHALITTPGATKWYRSEGALAEQHVTLRLAPGARLEWLPQEAMVYNSARARQSVAIDLAEDARYLGWDILMFGRIASNERFAIGRYEQALSVTKMGVPLWLERGHVDAGSNMMISPIGLAGYRVVATLIAAGTAPSAALVAACRAIGVGGGARSAITCLPQLLIARYLGDRVADAKNFLQCVWRELRPHYFGRTAQTPRIWST